MKTASPANVSEACTHKNISASTLIRTGRGRLLGIFVASTTSGTIKVWDNTSAAGTVIVNTFTPQAATFYPIPAELITGCYVTLANTIDCTVFFAVD
jgi:hypothetical protein